MSGLTSHARTSVLVDENGTVSGGVVASVSSPRFQDSVKGLASRKECRLVSRRSCMVLYIF